MGKQHNQNLQAIDIPHFKYRQALYHAFWNPKLYVDVGKRWTGMSIGYLLMLIAIVIIPYALHSIIAFDVFFQHKLIQPLQKIPVLYVQNGKVFIQEPVPYFVKNDLGEVIAIVDTSGKITKFDNQFPHLAILITQDKIAYRPLNAPQWHESLSGTSSIVTKVIPKKANQVFDARRWISSSTITTIRIISDIAIYPTLVAVFFMVFWVFLLIFTMLAQLIASMLLKNQLAYEKAFRLLMVASTPQLTVLFSLLALEWDFMGRGLMLIALLAVYFSYGVIALKRASNQLVRL